MASITIHKLRTLFRHRKFPELIADAASEPKASQQVSSSYPYWAENKILFPFLRPECIAVNRPQYFARTRL